MGKGEGWVKGAPPPPQIAGHGGRSESFDSISWYCACMATRRGLVGWRTPPFAKHALSSELVASDRIAWHCACDFFSCIFAGPPSAGAQSRAVAHCYFFKENHNVGVAGAQSRPTSSEDTLPPTMFGTDTRPTCPAHSHVSASYCTSIYLVSATYKHKSPSYSPLRII